MWIYPIVNKLWQNTVHYLDFRRFKRRVTTLYCNFQALNTMILFRTQISGTIPRSVGQLISLQVLPLDDNALNGSIPTSFGQLLPLSDLRLSYNNLICSIPGTVGALTKLTFLKIGSNSFAGTIPSAVGSMISLTQAVLSPCYFSGTIPSSMSLLTSLVYLDLRNNYLTTGTAASVPTSTFSASTLSGTFSLEKNCLAFSTTSLYRSVTATHCSPTSKYQLYNDLTWFLYHNVFQDTRLYQ